MYSLKQENFVFCHVGNSTKVENKGERRKDGNGKYTFNIYNH